MTDSNTVPLQATGKMPDRPSPLRWIDFPAVLTVLFTIAVLVQSHWHIMWRDEIRTWQIARESTGILSLQQNMRFDAVPVLWNAIVFTLTQMFSNPAAMQVVHALIAGAMVYVVARWAPFSRLNKVLFSLGYYPLYEYSVIARSYSLIFLLLMIACALIAQPRVRMLALGVTLLLMSQVSLWGAGFAVLMLVVALINVYAGKRDPRPHLAMVVAAGVLVLAGIGLCVAQLFPGPGISFVDSWFDLPAGTRLVYTVASIYRGLLPITQINGHFWNTNILDPAIPVQYPDYSVQAMLGLILLGFIIVLLLRRPLALGMFLVGAVALLGFMALRFRGATRHYGHLYMLLIAAFWIAQVSPEWKRPLPMTERLRGWHLSGLLALNALAGIIAVVLGLTYPFSASWAAAQFIKKNFGDDVMLAAVVDYSAAPVSQWLDRPIYFPQMRQFARYNTQDDAVRFTPSINEIFAELYDRSLEQKRNVVLLLNTDVAPKVIFSAGPNAMVSLATIPPGNELVLPVPHGDKNLTMHLRPVGAFLDGVVEDESQWVFLVSFDK